MRTSKKLNVLMMAAAASLVASSMSSAGTNRTWVGPDNGLWNLAENWSPSAVPQTGDSVYVYNAGPNFVIANYGNGESPTYSWLQVDSAGGGWMTLKQSGGILSTNGEAIGASHNGSFNQEGGYHLAAPTTTTPFYIGQGNGSFGAYNLLNGVLTTGSMYLGYQGNGYCNQDNGTHYTTSLMLGAQLNGVGFYTLNNGTLQAETVTVGAASGGAGRFYLNGGTLSTQRVEMGSPGAASFNMNGGTMNVARDVVVGNSNFNTAAATVSWNITAGRANVGTLVIGNTSPGWVDQFNGSVLNVERQITVGKGADGFLRLNAPTTSGQPAPQLTFGSAMIVGSAGGYGEVAFDGGYIWGDGGLTVAYQIGSRGAFNQNRAGCISSFPGIGIAAATNAVGTINVDGGAMTCRDGFFTALGTGGTLRINNNSSFVSNTGVTNIGLIEVNGGYLCFGEMDNRANWGQVSIGMGIAEGKRLEQNRVVIGNTSGATGGHIKLDRTASNATDVRRRSVIGTLEIWKNESDRYKGYLDLANNDLILTATSYSTAAAYLREGYNDGAWNGNGVRSSEAGNRAPVRTLGILRGYEYVNNNGATTFDGRSIGAEDVLIKYTYFGDVDFNGAIDASDYNIIDLGYVNHLTGWGSGDVDYSGAVDASDYNLIDLAYVMQTHTLARAIAYLDGTDRSAASMTSDPSLQQVVQHYAQFGETYATGFLAQVPEPSTAMITITAAATAMTTRRRRSTVASR